VKQLVKLPLEDLKNFLGKRRLTPLPVEFDGRSRRNFAAWWKTHVELRGPLLGGGDSLAVPIYPEISARHVDRIVHARFH